jgi:hypothetical protein
MQNPMPAAHSLTTFYGSVDLEDEKSRRPPLSSVRQLPPTFAGIPRRQECRVGRAAQFERGCFGWQRDRLVPLTPDTSDPPELTLRGSAE